MIAKIREIVVNEPQTVGELINELGLSENPVILAVNGVVSHPEVITKKRLEKGDKVTIIPLVAGG